MIKTINRKVDFKNITTAQFSSALLIGVIVSGFFILFSRIKDKIPEKTTTRSEMLNGICREMGLTGCDIPKKWENDRLRN